MIDKYKSIKGYFRIDAIKDGKIIDTFEKENLIMDDARYTFAKYLANINNTPVIDKFVLGTEGNVGAGTPGGGDLLYPKTDAEGFVSSRQSLFSEATGTKGVNYEDILFTVTGVSGDTVTASDGLSTVQCTVDGTSVIYVINIPNKACNGEGTMVYTECAFYTGSEIFSMRTFKGKIKDNTVSLKITWKIIF